MGNVDTEGVDWDSEPRQILVSRLTAHVDFGRFHFSGNDCQLNRSGIEFLGVLLISVISQRLPSITPLSASLGDPEHGDGADGIGGTSSAQRGNGSISCPRPWL